MLCLLLVAAAAATLYWLLKQPFKYWPKRGVKQGNPTIIFGDNWGLFSRQKSNAATIQTLYNIDKTARYCGMYQFMTPSLFLRDPELIKQITVKDFDHFTDHRTIIPEDSDPFFGKNLFSLTGQKWRDMRTTLSPAFTSSKMKHMFSLISQSGEQFVQHFLKQNKDVISVEMKDTITRFTNDVIANTAFGIECDSLEQPKNEFYLMGRKMTDFSGILINLKFFAYLCVPEVCRMLKIGFFSKDVRQFFVKLVSENIQSREKGGIVRPDMIHLLMEAQKHGSIKQDESNDVPDTGFATVEESDLGKTVKTEKTRITDEDITAQALIFFLGGFDSVASLMCFMSYELGVNPDVQSKLRQEVDDTVKKCNGKLTYEALMDMKYMDKVVSESLRKWPTAVAVDRVCTKPYTILPQNSEERPIELKQKDILIIPMFALHRDPKYFPDPDRFDPERFNETNKKNIKPYTFLPFGSGPRNCIGSRFALLETKILFFYILGHFEIVPVEKTQIPLQLAKNTIALTAEKGFWLGLKRREKV